MSDISEPSVNIDNLAQLYAVLFEAAELEHGIMCCYLYAMLGLRTEPSDGLPPDQLAAVKRWRDVIMSIAIEEMTHLALVSNLTVAFGARPHFGRQNFPVPPGYHPADIRLALAPFDRDTLDHFIFLERPMSSDIPDSPAFGDGSAYQRGSASGRFFPAGQDYATIGALYLQISAAIARLSTTYGEAVLFSGPREAQLGPDTVSLPGLLTIGSLADATQAVKNIVEQGEGAPEHDDHSHFASFIAIRHEYDAILSLDPSFTPSRPIARNPVMRRPPDPAGKVYVDAPEAAAILDAGNAAYTLMLICLAQSYARPAGHNPSEERVLVDAAIGLMGAASRLGAALSRFPASLALPGIHAGLNFNAPRGVPRFLPSPSEWLILSGGVARLSEGVAQLQNAPEAQSIASSLAAVATKLSGYCR
jgi:Ferritin-like